MILGHAVADLPVVVTLDGSTPLADTLTAARDAGLRVRCVDELLRIIVGRIAPDRTDALRAVVGIEAVEVERTVQHSGSQQPSRLHPGRQPVGPSLGGWSGVPDYEQPGMRIAPPTPGAADIPGEGSDIGTE